MAESNVKSETWEWDEPINWHGLEARVFIREPYGLIATVPLETWRPRERGRKHARLIAAAPELLKALKAAKEQIIALCSEDDVPEQVNIALAHAEDPS